MKLFDVIDKQKAYDEAAILKKFKGEAFTRQISVAKNYLSKNILKSLRLYHESSQPDAHLKESLAYIELLFDKGLYDICRKHLNKAKTQAKANEQIEIQQKLMMVEHHLVQRTRSENLLENFNILVRELKTLAKQKYEEEQLMIMDKISFMPIKMGHSHEHNDQGEFEEMMSHPLLQSEEKLGTLKAKVAFHRVWQAHFILKTQFDKATVHTGRIIELYEAENSFSDKLLPNYTSALNNHLNAAQGMNNWIAYETTLDKLRATRPNHPQAEAMWLERVIRFELRYLNRAGRFEEAIARIENEYAPKIKELSSLLQIEARQVIMLNIAPIYIAVGQYEKALDWLNETLDLLEKNLRMDIHMITRYLMVICHYELENVVLLESMMRSFYRYLVKHIELAEFERILLDSLRKMPRAFTKAERLKFFTNLKVELQKSLNESSVRISFELFHLVAWLESKIENRRYSEVFNERYSLAAMNT